jgi:hypothetical protein
MPPAGPTQMSFGLVLDGRQTYPLRQSLSLAHTRKQAAVGPFPPATQVLPDGHDESSPTVQFLLQYPPSVQG